MPQQIAVQEIMQSLEVIASVVDTLPSKDARSKLGSSLERLRISIGADMLDEATLQKSYEQFLQNLTEEALKSSGLDKSVFLMMVDVVMMIGYQLAAMYKSCQQWYNNLVAEYIDSSIVSLDIKEHALNVAMQQKQALFDDMKEVYGVPDMLKVSLENMLHKTQVQLDKTKGEIEVAQKVASGYRANAEIKSQEAELYKAYRDERVGDLVGAGKVKIQKLYNSLSELREVMAAKLGIKLVSDLVKSTDSHALEKQSANDAVQEKNNKGSGYVGKLQKEQQRDVIGGGRSM